MLQQHQLSFLDLYYNQIDGPKMIEALKSKGINQLYVIGGDGTHKGIENL
jgi:6-phosphofructokinase